MIGTAELEAWSQKGWPVLPVYEIRADGRCACGDPECSTPGKHPRVSNGVKAATTNLDQLRAWQQQWPASNWALATGEPSGVWVLDLDAKPGKPSGQQSLTNWANEHGVALVPTRFVKTGGDGWHAYYVNVDGLSNRTNVLPGMDVRATGGYVLLPGSNHQRGVYEVLSDVEPVLAPEALTDLIRRPAPVPAPRIEAGASLLDPIPEGERNDRLFRDACRLRRIHKDDRPLVDLIVRTTGRASGLSDREIDVLMESAFSQDHSDVSYPDLFREDAPRLNLRGASEVRKLPRPPYLIEGVMPEGALFQVFGVTGSYKSFVMLDMLASIANGKDWMGRKVNSAGPVAFVLGEGGYDAGVRIDAWMLGHPGASDDRLVYSIEEQLDLMDEGVVEQIVTDLEAWRAERFPSEPWRMIVFDTQADHMPMGDEDKAHDITVLKRSVQRIAHATGAAVGLVHHTGHDTKRERGSSRQRQSLDVVIQVDSQRITNVKQKGGPLFERIDFSPEPVGDSIVVQLTNPMVSAADSLDADLEVGRSVLAWLVDHPDASQNDLMRDLKLGRSSTWPKIRDLLERLGYVEVLKRGSTIRGVKPTVRGLAYFGIDGGDV